MSYAIPAFGNFVRTFTKSSGRLLAEQEFGKYFPDSAAAARKYMISSETSSKNRWDMLQLSSVKLSMLSYISAYYAQIRV